MWDGWKGGTIGKGLEVGAGDNGEVEGLGGGDVGGGVWIVEW